MGRAAAARRLRLFRDGRLGETRSTNFAVRYDEVDGLDVRGFLALLEDTRERLATVFPALPEEVGGVTHSSCVELDLTQPLLPVLRRVSVVDLVAREQGAAAAARLACSPLAPGGPREALLAAFDGRALVHTEGTWRTHLSRLAGL